MVVSFKGLGKFSMAGIVKVYPKGSSTPEPEPEPASWTQYVKTGGDSITSEHTGSSVAISNDGNWILMGAMGKGNDDLQNLENYFGAAYLLNWSGSEWNEVSKITNPEGDDEGAAFGNAVSMNSDGSKLAIAAPYYRNSSIGKIYIFNRTGNSVTYESTLFPISSDTSAEFGSSLSFSDTGEYLAVGSSFHGNNGRAYVFYWNGAAWIEQATIDKPLSNTTKVFGDSVSINGLGSVIIIGEPGYDTTIEGKAYVYSRVGSTWSLTQTLTPSDSSIGDNFGISVSISKDGNYIAVGANMNETSPGDSDSGSVYIFFWDGSSWIEQSKLIASDTVFDLRFGSSVSLSQDGSRVAIGANSDYYSSELRSTYVFDRVGSAWNETIKLIPASPDEIWGFDYREYGNSIDISNDGLTVVTGAPDPGIVEGSPSDLGKVYIHRYE